VGTATATYELGKGEHTGRPGPPSTGSWSATAWCRPASASAKHREHGDALDGGVGERRRECRARWHRGQGMPPCQTSWPRSAAQCAAYCHIRGFQRSARPQSWLLWRRCSSRSCESGARTRSARLWGRSGAGPAGRAGPPRGFGYGGQLRGDGRAHGERAQRAGNQLGWRSSRISRLACFLAASRISNRSAVSGPS
jgi:hypothetical protein